VTNKRQPSTTRSNAKHSRRSQKPSNPRRPVTPAPLPPERPIEESDGLNFVALVEGASRKNTAAKRKDPSIDVADLPVVLVMATGGPRTPGAPFRLSVPDLGNVIVDPQLATLAPEGELPTRALKATPALRLRAEKHATRIVGPLVWRWAKPRSERPITPREERFIEWLAERVVHQMMEERRAAFRAGPTASPDRR
jgi:hypothetical protein